MNPAKFIMAIMVIIIPLFIAIYFVNNPVGPIKIDSAKITSCNSDGCFYSVTIHNESAIPHNGFVRINAWRNINSKFRAPWPTFIYTDVSLQPSESKVIEGTVGGTTLFNAYVKTTE